MKRIAILFLSLSLPLTLAGCKTVTTTQPLAPGAYNQADQQLYSALMATEASLNSLKSDLENPATDAQTKSVLKPYVNQVIADYNLAELAYQAFHAALATNLSASPTAAQAALQKVQADLSQPPAVTK
jgi:hypothetical protein